METVKKHSLLFIDPYSSTSRNYAEKLKKIGFEVFTAKKDDSISDLISKKDPQIIILNITKKGKDCQDILATLKSNSLSTHIPVIVIAGANNSALKAYSFLQGACDYIVRPFEFSELLARIINQLEILNTHKELEKRNKFLEEKIALLEQMAVTDMLTGLYNRRYIMDRLHCEVSHSSRYNEPISFIMLDIDHFKNINDTYGHISGDIILKEIAGQIKTTIRGVDIAARYGGEEFLVVCPNTDIDGGRILAERIKDSIESSTYVLDDCNISITMSLGVTSRAVQIHADPWNEISSFINEADMALYRAKARGRNRVEIYDGNAPLHTRDTKRNSGKLVKTGSDVLDKFAQ